MLNYFPPKTKHVKLNNGGGGHKPSRGGSFVIELVNNQYNDFHFWCYTGIDPKSGKYWCGLYNHKDSPYRVSPPCEAGHIEFRKEGFDTEQEAADALDQFAAELATRFLEARLKTLKAQQKTIKDALMDYWMTRTTLGSL